MLLDFSVKNYLSFKDEVCFSMLGARSVKEHEGMGNSSQNNVIKLGGKEDSVLKVAVVYGANGSGKSNLLKSVSHMRDAVLNSFLDDTLIEGLSRNVYGLDVNNQKEGSLFEINFMMSGAYYRYGFEFRKGLITQEWLFKRGKDSSRESYCFKRESNDIQVNSKIYKGTRGVIEKTRLNSLFLSTCAQFNVEEALILKRWFNEMLIVISEVNGEMRQSTALDFKNNPRMRKMILSFMQNVDAGIKGIKVFELLFDPPKLDSEDRRKIMDFSSMVKPCTTVKKIDIYVERSRFQGDEYAGSTLMPLSNESAGTQKVFDLAGPWFSTLSKGGTLLVDEFGASLHTKLAIELIKLYLNKFNRSAQLVVATHDTNILRKDLLRRDQIWFTEKNEIGATDLYSLVEYKINQAQSVRNDASYCKDYLLGKYGAIPYFGNTDELVRDFVELPW